MCFLLFALGVPMCTEGGVFLFQLMDFYSASGMALLWVCFFQTIAIGWFFGTERLEKTSAKFLPNQSHDF
jgi:solute carrier family 6 GABA transporter-like protein 1